MTGDIPKVPQLLQFISVFCDEGKAGASLLLIPVSNINAKVKQICSKIPTPLFPQYLAVFHLGTLVIKSFQHLSTGVVLGRVVLWYQGIVLYY